MNYKQIFKNSFIYKKIYYPYRLKQIQSINQVKKDIFKKVGRDTLVAFVNTMEKASINYWLEFGSLLGAYRDGAFVPNEMDIDVGMFLKDAKQAYEALVKAGFRLVREFHVVGENGLEQTYEFNGTTIDVMYFFEEGGLYWCNGAVFPRSFKQGAIFEHMVTAHHFIPFSTVEMEFLGMKVSIPSNAHEHLIEIYGANYRVYDPNFKVDFNKEFYNLEEKKGIGFIFN